MMCFKQILHRNKKRCNLTFCWQFPWLICDSLCIIDTRLPLIYLLIQYCIQRIGNYFSPFCIGAIIVTIKSIRLERKRAINVVPKRSLVRWFLRRYIVNFRGGWELDFSAQILARTGWFTSSAIIVHVGMKSRLLTNYAHPCEEKRFVSFYVRRAIKWMLCVCRRFWFWFGRSRSEIPKRRDFATISTTVANTKPCDPKSGIAAAGGMVALDNNRRLSFKTVISILSSQRNSDVPLGNPEDTRNISANSPKYFLSRKQREDVTLKN